MKIRHWVRREDSGLMRSALEFVHFEEQLGHDVSVVEPSGDGKPLYGSNGPCDLHVIHSQFSPEAYHDDCPKVMVMHGEPA